MDKLKIAKAVRKQYRRIFITACNAYETENKLCAEEKLLKLRLLKEKAHVMIEAEENVRTKLFSMEELDEGELCKEMDESEAYLDRWREMAAKLGEPADLCNRKIQGAGGGSEGAPQIPTATGLYSSPEETLKACVFCSGQHKVEDCIQFVEMSLAGRQASVEKIQTQLQSNEKQQEEVVGTSVFETEVTEPLAHVPSVMLQTFAVKLVGNGASRKVRAIIDSGSQRSYILQSTAEKVHLVSSGKKNIQHSLFGGDKTDMCEHNVFKIHLCSLSKSYSCNFDVLSQPLICKTMPHVGLDPWIRELSDYGINVIDGHGEESEILIRADVAAIHDYLESMLHQIERGESTMPKDVVQKLMRSFYVDDCVQSVEELQCVIETSRTVMAERQFDLRGWECLDPTSVEDAMSSVLGMLWNRSTGTLQNNSVSFEDFCWKDKLMRIIKNL